MPAQVPGPGGQVERIVEHKDADAAVRAVREVNTGIMLLPREDLARIVQAGLQAPSGCNAQSTTFVILDDPDLIARRWRSAGPDPAPATPLGLAADGPVEIDLVRDGPHALVAGMGAGLNLIQAGVIIERTIRPLLVESATGFSTT